MFEITIKSGDGELVIITKEFVTNGALDIDAFQECIVENLLDVWVRANPGDVFKIAIVRLPDAE
jgi:hypothetical protein